MSTKIHEEAIRSLVKAITYRLLIVLSNGIIVFAITHNYSLTLEVLLISNLASTIIYFVHERVWNKIHWGRLKQYK
jgi:uncharacterized membrane protein